ncbi:MAG: DUF423 domain-containing protein [Planctomycetaceae bacterium]|nr:DUF423 domain-containing protein [Planctomycetaceae bacterium]
MSGRTCCVLASLLGFLAVFAGAFGAHGLADSGFLTRKYAETEAKQVAGFEVPASWKYLQDFQTGVRYHMWHALALFGTGLLQYRRRSRLLTVAAWCFVGGILLFSGSLYVLVIGGPMFAGIRWGMVAPFGGTLLLIGWILLAVAAAGQGDQPSGPTAS